MAVKFVTRTITPELYRLEEVALITGLSKSYIETLIYAGKLPCVKFGQKAIRLSRQTVDEFIAKHSVPAKQTVDASEAA